MRTRALLLTFPVDFRISRFHIIYSHHVVVTIADDQWLGAGSGVLYGASGAAVAGAWREWLCEALSELTPDGVEAAWPALLARALAVDPGAAYAMDSALWDWRGQQAGKPVSELLGGRRREQIAITEQIFIDDWEASEDALRQILERGTTSLKIKIGFSLDEDLRLIRRTRQFIGDNVTLRLDANRAYSYGEAADFYRQAADWGVVAVEEPIRYRDPEELARFREDVGLPVMLDESILSVEDLERAIEADGIDSLNIKLSRVGGLSQALVYRRLCEEAGVAVSIGCSEDVGPGMASILHLAASTEQLASTEGVGHMRLGADLIQETMAIEEGRVNVPTAPGLGVTLHRDLRAHLKGRAQVLDLSTAPAWLARGRSVYHRNRQRAATLVHRIRRSMQA